MQPFFGPQGCSLSRDAIYDVPVKSNAIDVPELHEWLHDQQFHALQFVTVGAQVRLLKNLDVEHSFALGCQNGHSEPEVLKTLLSEIACRGLRVILTPDCC